MSSKSESLRASAGSHMAESLGRRPDAVPAPVPAASANKRFNGITRDRNAGEVPLANIIADPDQPRTEFEPDALARLAASLKTHGQLQAVRVRWSEPHEKWMIVAGERRFRAAQLAGLATLKCLFVEGGLSESVILEEQLIENCLREDLTPIEQANAFKALMDRNGWSGRELAERLSLNAPGVTRALALLTLPEDIQEKVTEGEIGVSAAYEVSKLDNPAEQRALVEEAAAENLSRDAVAERVAAKRGKAKKALAAKTPPARSSTASYTTPKRWKLVLTIPKAKATDAEIVAELEALLDQLKAKAGSKAA